MNAAIYEVKMNEQRARFAAARAKAAKMSGVTRGVWEEALGVACEYLDEGMEGCDDLSEYEYNIVKAESYAFAAEQALRMVPYIIEKRAERAAAGFSLAH